MTAGRRSLSRPADPSAPVPRSDRFTLINALAAMTHLFHTPARPASLRRAHPALIAAVAVLVIIAMSTQPGCRGRRATSRSIAATRPDTASPAVRGADSGLEMWWWVVTDLWAPPPDPATPPEAAP